MSFYGAGQFFVPVETLLPGITTPRELYAALLECWGPETCAPRMRAQWTVENPTLGQCSVTAFLAQDLFGGRVYGIPLPDGGFHCYNVTQGKIFDLTSEQFGSVRLSYAGNSIQYREEHFAKQEKYERYLVLKKRLFELRK